MNVRGYFFAALRQNCFADPAVLFIRKAEACGTWGLTQEQWDKEQGSNLGWV